MLLTFSFADKIDPVAVYAAIVATCVLIWDVIKWLKSGPRLFGKAKAGMRLVGGPGDDDQSSYIVFTIYNRGAAPLTLTNLGIVAFSSWWHRLRRRPEHTFIVKTGRHVGHSVPHVLKPGEQFMTLARQNEQLEALSRSHLTYGAVYHTHSERELLVRIEPIPAQKPAAD